MPNYRRRRSKFVARDALEAISKLMTGDVDKALTYANRYDIPHQKLSAYEATGKESPDAAMRRMNRETLARKIADHARLRVNDSIEEMSKNPSPQGDIT